MDAYVQATQGGGGSATMILAMLKRIKSVRTSSWLKYQIRIIIKFLSRFYIATG